MGSPHPSDVCSFFSHLQRFAGKKKAFFVCSLMTSYTAAPPIRAGGSQSALASGVTRAYASGVQGGAYVAGMRAPQARYAVVPRVVPSTSAPGSSVR